jgi:tetratricopeptide (TPR) repeat protein
MDVTASGGCEPYVGRRAFDVRDQRLFFGRDRESSQLSSLWEEDSLVVLHGPPGSGKTSLLQAGAIPALPESADVLPIGSVSLGSPFPEAVLPEHNPLTLAVLSSWSPAESRTSLSQCSVTDFLRDRALANRWSRGPALIFAAIDQFEEIFADTHEARHRDAFMEDLAEALRTVPELRILLSVRSDFLAELAPFKAVLAIRGESQFLLPALSRDDALSAVRTPMENAGFQFAAGAAEDLVENLLAVRGADTTGESALIVAGIEPVQLQVVCSDLRRALPPDSSVITFDFFDVESLVTRSLAGFCVAVLAEVAAEQRIAMGALRTWLEQTFISPRGTRSMVPEALPATAGMPHLIARGLENRHLLTSESRSGIRWYALANDRLIGAVRQLNSPVPIDSAPIIDAVSHLRAAVTLTGEGELVLAEKHAWQALKAAKGEDLRLKADARSLLGNIAFERGRLDTAEEHYWQAAELCEQLRDQSAVGSLLGAIGRMHAEQGRYEAALEDLLSAVTRLPGDLTLQTELGKALWNAGQRQAAAAVFGTVLTIEPDFAEALAGRGQVRAEKGNALFALEDLGALRRLRPAMGLQPEVRSAYALALARVGRSETAMEEADAALEAAPDNGLIFLRAARVANASGALERATALLRRATEASDPALSSEQLNEARRLMRSARGADG